MFIVLRLYIEDQGMRAGHKAITIAARGLVFPHLIGWASLAAQYTIQDIFLELTVYGVSQ